MANPWTNPEIICGGSVYFPFPNLSFANFLLNLFLTYFKSSTNLFINLFLNLLLNPILDLILKAFSSLFLNHYLNLRNHFPSPLLNNFPNLVLTSFPSSILILFPNFFYTLLRLDWMLNFVRRGIRHFSVSKADLRSQLSSNFVLFINCQSCGRTDFAHCFPASR